MNARRPTVVQVARRAGVSIASVSRVLNGKTARPDTTDRVRAAAAELGYLPDAAGRSLKLGSGRQVTLAVDDIGNPVYSELMQGVSDGLSGTGARLSIASTGHEPAELAALVRNLSRGLADGLVISPLRRSVELLRSLVDSPIPVVVVGNLDVGVPLDSVRIDSAGAVRLAYRHLQSMGAGRIAFVGGPADTAPGGARLAAFRELADHGDHGRVLVTGSFTVRSGERAWQRLAALDPAEKPDAVLAANDLLALGVLRGALSSGVAVPEQLAVAGIDDITFARVFSPALTSVSLRSRERGRLAADLLQHRMSDPTRPPQTRRVTPRLVVRESTCRS